VSLKCPSLERLEICSNHFSHLDLQPAPHLKNAVLISEQSSAPNKLLSIINAASSKLEIFEFTIPTGCITAEGWKAVVMKQQSLEKLDINAPSSSDIVTFLAVRRPSDLMVLFELIMPSFARSC